MRTYIFLSVVFLFLTSCRSSAVFEEYKEIDDESWSRFDIIEFTANIPDSGRYYVQAGLRHTTDYEMVNLWCFISTRSTASEQLCDTINFKVAEPDGRWLGQGTRIKNVLQPIRCNPVVLPKGRVIFRIEQGMRQENLKGVKNIGLVIEKIK